MPSLFGYLMSSTTDGSSSSIRKLSDDLIKTRINEEVEETDFYAANGRRLSFDRKSSIGGVSSNDSLWGDARRLSEAGIRRTSDNSIVLTEDTDSFIIGDRVWVGGSKPGQIAFIGETQFAPGDWAGIVLDEAIGKNDGSVGGIRYFQCETKKGVFSRLGRLTRFPLVTPTLSMPSPTPPSPSPAIVSPSSSIKSSSILKTPPPMVSPPSPVPVGEIKVGERVIVMSSQGSKAGVLRYKGPTSFASGEWCGVELDDPLGKNDGSVDNKRYFVCAPKYGLFAPAHKVSRSPAPGRRPSCQVHHSSTVRRASSKESISSIASSIRTNNTTTSTARVRLGVNSLQKPLFARPSASPTTPKPSSQDLLKSKQDQIMQLLKEREMDRSSLTKAAEQADEAERKLGLLQEEFKIHCNDAAKKIGEFQVEIAGLQKDKSDLLSQLEDVQFRAEEETIYKSDIQVANDQNVQKIKDLTNLVMEQRGKIEELALESRMLKDSKASLACIKEELDTVKMSKIEMEKVLKQELIETIDRANRMEENYNEAQSKIDNLLSGGDTAKQQLLEFNSTIDNLNKEINALTLKNVDSDKLAEKQKEDKIELLKSLESTNAHNSKLSIEISNLTEKGNKLEEENKSLSSKIELLTKNLDIVTKELEVKVKECSITDADLKKMTDEMKESKQTENNNLQIIAKLKEEIENNKVMAKKLVEDLTKRSNCEIDALKKEFSNFDSQLKQRESELSKHIQEKTLTDEQNNLLSNEINTLKKSLEDKVKDIENKKEEILSLKQEVDRFKDELAKANKSSNESEELLNSNYKEITQTLAIVQNELKSVKDEKNQLAKEKDEAFKEFDATVKSRLCEIENLKIETNSLNNEINKKNLTITDLEIKISQSESLIKEKQNDITGQSEINDKLQNELQVLDKKYCEMIKIEENLCANEQKLKLEVGDSNRKLENLEERCKELIITKDKLEKYISELMNTSSDSSTQLNKINDELMEVQKKYDSLKVNMSTLVLEQKNKEQELILKLTAAKEENEKISKEFAEQVSASNESKINVQNSYKQRISELESELENTLKVNDVDKKQKEELNTKVQELELSFKDIQAKFHETVQSKESLLKEMSEMNTKFAENEQEKNVKTEKIDELIVSIKSLENVVKTLNEEKGNLDAKIVESEKKNSELTINLNKINEDNALLQQQSDTLKTFKETELLSIQNQILAKDECIQQNATLINELQNQVKNCMMIVDSKTEELEARTQEITSLRSEIIKTLEEQKQFKEGNDLLIDSTEKMKTENLLLERELSTFKNSGSELTAVIQSLEGQISTLKESLERSETQINNLKKTTIENDLKLDKLTKEKLDTEKSLTEELKGVKGSLEDLQSEYKNYSSKVSQQECETSAELQVLTDKLKQSLDENINVERSWNNKVVSIESVNKELNKSLDIMRKMEVESSENISLLNLKLESVNKEKLENMKLIETLKGEIKQLQVVLSNKTTKEKKETGNRNTDSENIYMETKQEKEKLNKELEDSKQLNKKLQVELDNIKTSKISENKNNILNLETQVKCLESEKNKLEQQLSQLQIEMKTFRESGNVSNNLNQESSELTNWLEEKELAESQINFLNSIIVDMKKKNEFLTEKMDAMELGETYDRKVKVVKEIAPRLFCDICDVFDAHDTDDCPRQASSDSPPPVQEHKSQNRNASRPYCDICEIFGHDTEDCDEAETF